MFTFVKQVNFDDLPRGRQKDMEINVHGVDFRKDAQRIVFGEVTDHDIFRYFVGDISPCGEQIDTTTDKWYADWDNARAEYVKQRSDNTQADVPPPNGVNSTEEKVRFEYCNLVESMIFFDEVNFHPDTDPAEYIQPSGAPMYSADEVESIRNIFDRAERLLGDEVYRIACDVMQDYFSE